ncbi:MAG: DUF4199 domain-containing protein [Saprospiraceae bacterium]|nr:DUF4199 domain-containing protein [Saprospiraceae bacterium]
MQQIILRYGLLSGVVAAVLMTITVLNVDFEYGAYYGYTGILLSMLFVFFGVKAYREQVGGGVLSFGKGFLVGLLIALISSLCYVLAWMVVYQTMIPDMMDQYMKYSLDRMRASGTSEAEILKQSAMMEDFNEQYKNPLFRFAHTFSEPLPVGLLVALVSALVLRKR